jgi:ribonuclease BN (tRNA processing enzyme)
LLIDCGCDVTANLERLGILDKLAGGYLWVAITHTHDDHCGSLGSLIFKCYDHNVTPVIFCNKKVEQVLDAFNVGKEFYRAQYTRSPIKTVWDDFVNTDNGTYGYSGYPDLEGKNKFTITPIVSKHYDLPNCYSFDIELTDPCVKIFYSGDFPGFNDETIDLIRRGEYNEVYAEATDHVSHNHHYNIEDYKNFVNSLSEKVKNHTKFYARHLDKWYETYDFGKYITPVSVYK